MTRKFIEALAAALKRQCPTGYQALNPVRYEQWSNDVNAVASTIEASYARALFLELVQDPAKDHKVAQ